MLAGLKKTGQVRDTHDIHYRMSPIGDGQIKFPRLTAYKVIRTMGLVNAQIDELTKEFGCPEPRGKDDSYKVFSTRQRTGG